MAKTQNTIYRRCFMLFNALVQALFTRVDASSLAVFRIGFGLLMTWTSVKYLYLNWVARYYIDLPFHFKYYGFSWIDLPDGERLYWIFLLQLLCALLITLGLFYRVAIILFSLLFSYVFLLDQTQYLNHFYMVILFALSLCLMPANRLWSLDARLFRKAKPATIAYANIWVLRAQLEIILIYAGLVKLNPDWLRLEPLASWLESRSALPIVGDLFLQHWAVAMAAYGVIALHLIGAPLLLWRRARIPVLILYAVFHCLNSVVFRIGIFPWFTLFASFLFFAPNWPRQFIAKWTAKSPTEPEPASVEGTLHDKPGTTLSAKQIALLMLMLLWLGYQLLMPARGLLYPGNMAWTEQGHRFAWRMKLRDKRGKTTFYLKDGVNSQRIAINPRFILSKRQFRKMSVRPDMILQFAHYLRDVEAPKRGIRQAQVYVEAWVSLNFRRPARLIDPNRDLAQVPRNLWTADWILPLEEPFRISGRWDEG